MSSFDIVHNSENLFIKNHPYFQKMMFGTTGFIPFWIADMEFKVAHEITQAIHEIADRGVFSYEFTHNDVVEAIANWNFNRHQLELKPMNFIQVTTGVLTVLSVIIQELTEQGGSVVIQTPVYHQFEKVINSAQRNVVENPLCLANGIYKMDLEGLETIFKEEKPKKMIFCNPHNPVGRVWNREEIQGLLTLADNYGVTIVSDEIHSDIVYKGAQFNSISSFDSGRNHIAILGSPAKTFGMHSIANGFFYTENQMFYDKLKTKISGMYLDHGNAISGYATIAAYKKGGKWVDELVKYLAETNTWVKEFIENEFSEVVLIQPEGTYQIWLDFSGLGFSNEALKNIIFEKAKIGLTPGEWFGAGYDQFMRMNIASPRIVIQEAFKTLRQELSITE